jgi:tetratricopeptide (TPR) repeat protein
MSINEDNHTQLDVLITKNTISVSGDTPSPCRLNPYYQDKLIKEGFLPANELIAYGYELFNNIFSTEKRIGYINKTLSDLKDDERFTIAIMSDDSDIHNIPFEILNNSRKEDDFLLKRGNISIVRDMPALDKRVIPAVPPIRILILLSLPLKTYEANPIDPLKELHVIYKALSEYIDSGVVEIDVEEKVNIPVVRERLLKGHYHIVHFIGHGSEGGFLVIEDEGDNKQEKLLTAEEMKNLFKGSNVSLFYFDACETAKASPYTPSLAQHIYSGIKDSYIIANLASVRDDLATEATGLIYKSLFGDGLLDNTLNSVRVRLNTDWWKPVIFCNPQKRIFNLSKGVEKKHLKRVIYRPPRTIKNYVYRYGIVREASSKIEGGSNHLALHGIGGAGKSTMAVYLSEFFDARFRHIVFIDLKKEKVKSPEDIISIILREFGIEGIIDTKEYNGLHLIKQWRLLNETINDRWLIILDNLEVIQDENGIIIDGFQRFIEEILNTVRVFTIFTSRLKPLFTQRKGLEHILDIGEYTDGEISFLLRDTDDERRIFFIKNHNAINGIFGNHPLSLSLILEKSDLTIANIFEEGDMKETLEFYKKYLEKYRHETEILFCLKYPVSRIFLNKLFGEGFILLLTERLRILKCNNNHYIPYRVITSYFQGAFKIEDLSILKVILMEKFPDFSKDNAGLSFLDLMNILNILNDYYEKTGDSSVEEHITNMFNGLASIEDIKRNLPENFLKSITKLLNKESHRDTEKAALTCHNLASIYEAKGEYDKAIEFYNKALKINEVKLGLDHPDTAATYNNLAGVYRAKGDYDRAIEFSKKALKIYDEKLGLDHPDAATTYNNLAGVYKAKGEYERAIEFYEKVLKIQEEKLGLDNPDTVTTYNNLALVYEAKGEYDKAIGFYEKAIQIQELKLGLGHPSTATTSHNLALVYSAKGEYEIAIKLHKKALKIKEAKLGLGHPDIANSYNNIATVYYAKEEYDKAIEFYEKALKIRESKLGLDHPNTANTYNNLGLVYYTKGELEKATKFYEKALKIHESKLGLEHPMTATSYNNLAGVYYAKGALEKATEFYEKSLKICESKLGLEHPNTTITYNNLAGIYHAKGDSERAIEFYEKALKIRESKLGLDHPDTADNCNNLALVYHAKGEYGKAIDFYEKSLKIYERGKSYMRIFLTLPFLIDSFSHLQPIDYSRIGVYLCDFLELFEIFRDKKDEIVFYVINFFIQNKTFERIAPDRLKDSIIHDLSKRRLDNFFNLIQSASPLFSR